MEQLWVSFLHSARTLCYKGLFVGGSLWKGVRLPFFGSRHGCARSDGLLGVTGEAFSLCLVGLPRVHAPGETSSPIELFVNSSESVRSIW